MQKPGNAFARGSELIVGLFVVAFIVFLLWVILLRPQTSDPRPQTSDHRPPAATNANTRARDPDHRP